MECRAWELPRVLVVGVLFGVTASCGDPPPSNYPTQSVYVEDSTLAAGDVIDIRVFYGSKELVRSYSVGSAGTIAFPLIGDVQISGKSQREIEQEMQARLADGYLQNPVVSVVIKELNSKKIAVLGEVQKPGTLMYFEGMTIVEAISQAGGFTAMARKNSVTVTRRNEGKKMNYTVPVEAIAQNRAANFAVRPGDVVFVRERLW
jgi:protein involved in polysaccharide export with SLBB domain